MTPKLIIIRGNSASGKTTLAKALRHVLPQGQTMLSQQDVVRREMLGVKDRPGNLAIALIKEIATYGYQNCQYIIIEGILGTEIYQEMFEELVELFKGSVNSYYFEIPFEETVKRHKNRPQAVEFDVAKMKDWWLEKDYLRLESEQYFDEAQRTEELVNLIMSEIIGSK